MDMYIITADYTYEQPLQANPKLKDTTSVVQGTNYKKRLKHAGLESA